jgi:hypothetical protein
MCVSIDTLISILAFNINAISLSANSSIEKQKIQLLKQNQLTLNHPNLLDL